MKKISIFILAFLILFIPLFQSNTLASGNYSVFSTVPDATEIERQKQYELPESKAWETNKQGKVVPVRSIVFKRNTNIIKNGKIGTMSWVDADGYVYVFNDYAQNNYLTDSKRFFVSRVTLENKGSQPLPLKYIQQETVQTNWVVSSKISAEADLGNKFIAKLKTSLELSVARSSTTYSSTTIEAGPTYIPPGYGASYTKYRKGAFGQGQAEWKKYAPGGTSWIGMYYTGESGWVPVDNDTTLVYSEYKL